ncbi:MAG: hypothetical protein ACFFEF_05645 [Candidatus Thorarchaeota archaeon]
MQVPLKETPFNEDGQHLDIVFQDNWIRIILLRDRYDSKSISIEVELSIPYIDTGSSSFSNADESISKILAHSIDCLHYIQRLGEIGFELELVGRELLWSASKKYDEVPDLQVFQMLLPPRL